MANNLNPNGARLVGERSITPWVVGLLLLLALIIGWSVLFAKDKYAVVEKTPEMRAQEQVAEQAEDRRELQQKEVESAADLYTVTDKTLLINRPVDLADAKVMRVVSDRVFWIDAGANRIALVYLPPALDAGSAEKAVKVEQGQELDIKGQVRALPPSSDMASQWALTVADVQTAQMANAYIFANSVAK